MNKTPGLQIVQVWQALLPKHSLIPTLMHTRGHWQVAKHSEANPPEIKQFCLVEIALPDNVCQKEIAAVLCLEYSVSPLMLSTR